MLVAEVQRVLTSNFNRAKKQLKKQKAPESGEIVTYKNAGEQ